MTASAEHLATIARLEGERDAAINNARAATLSILYMPGVREALDGLPPTDPVTPYLALANQALTAESTIAKQAERLKEMEGALERIARWEKHGGEKPLVYPVDIAKEALAHARALTGGAEHG